MTKTHKQYTEERLPREVIENQLLARLQSDKSQVALLCGIDDLNMLIQALDALAGLKEKYSENPEKCEEFAASLKQLRKAAFNQ